MISILLAVLAFPSAPAPSGDPDCGSLKALVREVYVFKPSKLSKKEQGKKVNEMDRVWTLVRENKKVLAPCLRALLEDDAADPWFRVDGSALLVDVDPSPESKKLQIACWSRADFQDIDPSSYVPIFASLGFEGLDTTATAERWLRMPDASYFLSRHGGFKVGNREGSIFLWGTIDEAIATPALAKLVRGTSDELREHALFLLQAQATAEAWKTLRSLDPGTLSAASRKGVAQYLAKPALGKKGASDFVTRAKILAGFEAFLKGDPDPLMETQFKDGKTEKDWAARVAGVLQDEDLPLLRKVRRKRLTYQSDEALEDFKNYTAILITRTWNPEYAK